MNKYYQIVPTNDGYNRLAYSRMVGKHYLQRKEIPHNDDSLIFETQAKTNIYMQLNKLNPKEYEVEEFWMA